MTRTLAIVYSAADYTAADRRPIGRRAATEGLLTALARHASAEEMLCVTTHARDFDAFCEHVQAETGRQRKLTWVPPHEIDRLAEADIVIRPDPLIEELAWLRHATDHRAFSLLGLTHNISTPRALQAIGGLALGPFQPWDALVFPSEAVKTAAENVLADWCGYLRERTGGEPRVPVRMPVIPLGVDTAAFDLVAERARARDELGLGVDDVAFLFVGRLGPRSKAHPVPMYVALERAAAATQHTLHLLQVGWFADPGGEEAFRAASAAFAPSVRHRFLDGGRSEIRTLAWAAADVFVSLADNVQETFGLTPIEAMAAGLPVVVSEWDGYRESVLEGENGFLVPTLVPPAGAGADLARAQLAGALEYFDFIGNAAAATAVDVQAAAHALVTLADDPGLRERMGAEGQRRARERFDWGTVIGDYEALWDGLDEARAGERETVPSRGRPGPLHPDPFEVFGHYATRGWGPQDRLVVSDDAHELLRLAETDALIGYAAGRRLAPTAAAALVAAIADAGGMEIGALLDAHDKEDDPRRRRAQLSIAGLLKLGVLRIEPRG